MPTDITPIPFRPDRLIKATGGVFLCNHSDNLFDGVSIDSRKTGKKDLFVAIRGENHDGHTFINDLVESGVKGLIINEEKKADFPVEAWNKKGITCIAVKDTITALGALANSQRIEAGVKVVAITGSNGKTSTRAMTASIFSQRFITHATSGNFNNEIGLPLTLLKLGYQHEWAVVELGMNAPGEIERLGRICMPDIGVITNVGTAHLEGLGSIENIARAKGEILSTINTNGTAVINAAIPLFSELIKEMGPDLFVFGESENANVKASSISVTNGFVRFQLTIGQESATVTLKTPGVFMVPNALAAASAGVLAGFSIEEIKHGLENFTPVKGRMTIIKTDSGLNLIDDTYNANPDSMMAAITTLKKLTGKGRSFLVAGDMLELGEGTVKLHEQIGSFAAGSGIENLCITGRNAEHVSKGAQNSGMSSEFIFTGTKKEIITNLSKKLNKGDWILIKGSRSMAMEEIVKELSKGA